MESERLQLLLKKHRDRQLTAQERSELYTWYNIQSSEIVKTDEQEVYRRLQALADRLPITKNQKQHPIRKLYPIGWVAAILLLAGFIYWLYMPQEDSLQATYTVHPANLSSQIILPDQRTLSMDSLVSGDSILLPHVKIHKDSTGMIVYSSHHDTYSENSYHTVTTPIGGELSVRLPDGTQVWLNSASRLRFPLDPNTGHSKLELEGEGYFEVARHLDSDGQPRRFSVHSHNQTVEVLGTKFNIRAYSEEHTVSTSLLEGSVQLHTTSPDGQTDKQLRLLPGQIAIWNKTQHSIDVQNTKNIDPLSWKEGYFSFHGDDIQQVCKELSRWYQVDFSFTSDIAPGSYYGDISKQYTLNEVLDILVLESLRYHISYDGGKLTVHLSNK